MKKLAVESTARASFYFYNTTEEIDHFVELVLEIQRYFGTLGAIIQQGSSRHSRKWPITEGATGMRQQLAEWF
jgi:hypothetical protein